MDDFGSTRTKYLYDWCKDRHRKAGLLQARTLEGLGGLGYWSIVEAIFVKGLFVSRGAVSSVRVNSCYPDCCFIGCSCPALRPYHSCRVTEGDGRWKSCFVHCTHAHRSAQSVLDSIGIINIAMEIDVEGLSDWCLGGSMGSCQGILLRIMGPYHEQLEWRSDRATVAAFPPATWRGKSTF